MSLLWRVPETGAPELQFRTRAVGWEFFQNLIRNRPFLRLVAAWFMNGLANGLPAVLFLLYMEHALGADSEQRASLILTYFVSAVAGIPLWMQLSRHWSKHRTWCAAMIIARRRCNGLNCRNDRWWCHSSRHIDPKVFAEDNR